MLAIISLAADVSSACWIWGAISGADTLVVVVCRNFVSTSSVVGRSVVFGRSSSVSEARVGRYRFERAVEGGGGEQGWLLYFTGRDGER